MPLLSCALPGGSFGMRDRRSRSPSCSATGAFCGGGLLRPGLGRRFAALLRARLRQLLDDRLRRRQRAALANQLDEALGDLDDLGRFRRR